MIDLTENILNSIKLNKLWGINGFYICKEKLENHGYCISFWEDEESWATVLTEKNHEIVGYLWHKNPFLILKNTDDNLISHSLFTNIKIEIMVCENFLDKIFFIKDKEIMKNIFQCCWHMPFSVDDLWFYTNSA